MTNFNDSIRQKKATKDKSEKVPPMTVEVEKVEPNARAHFFPKLNASALTFSIQDSNGVANRYR